MAYLVDFSGGQSGNFTAWTKVSPSWTQDLTAVTGYARQTLEGTYSVRIENISVAGGSGFSAYYLTYGGSSNDVYIDGPGLGAGNAYSILAGTTHSVRPHLEKTANSTATFQRLDRGGSVREWKTVNGSPSTVYTWSPASMCGYFEYSLPTTAPTNVGVSRVSRNVTVTWGAPSDLGEQAVTNYIIQYEVGSGAYSTKVGTAISSVNTSTNTITTTDAHGLAAGDVVYFMHPSYPSLNSGNNGGNPVMGGTSAYTPYFVRTKGLTSTSFTISTTGAGGAAVDLTDSGYGTVHVYQSDGHVKVASTARSYTYSNLTAGQTYTFRVSAINAAGTSVAAVSSSVLVTAAGRRYDATNGWTNINNAMRYDGSTWLPITTVKRYDGTNWIDLTTSI